MKNIIIAPSEVIAILKYEQEKANRNGINTPVGMFAQKQVSVCEFYLDNIVSDLASEIGKSNELVLLTAHEPKLSTKTIHVMGKLGTQPKSDVSQMTDRALEAKIVTEASRSEVHVPKTAEVLQKVAESKLPATTIFMEEGIREKVLELYGSGNKVAAIKLVMKYYNNPNVKDGKFAPNYNAAMVIINEWLGIDPLIALKQKVASLYETDPNNGYTLAFRFVEENLKNTIQLTGNPKEDASLVHKFTWDIINNLSQTRREQMAGRRQKKNL